MPIKGPKRVEEMAHNNDSSKQSAAESPTFVYSGERSAFRIVQRTNKQKNDHTFGDVSSSNSASGSFQQSDQQAKALAEASKKQQKPADGKTKPKMTSKNDAGNSSRDEAAAVGTLSVPKGRDDEAVKSQQPQLTPTKRRNFATTPKQPALNRRRLVIGGDSDQQKDDQMTVSSTDTEATVSAVADITLHNLSTDADDQSEDIKNGLLSQMNQDQRKQMEDQMRRQAQRISEIDQQMAQLMAQHNQSPRELAHSLAVEQRQRQGSMNPAQLGKLDQQPLHRQQQQQQQQQIMRSQGAVVGPSASTGNSPMQIWHAQLKKQLLARLTAVGSEASLDKINDSALFLFHKPSLQKAQEIATKMVEESMAAINFDSNFIWNFSDEIRKSCEDVFIMKINSGAVTHANLIGHLRSKISDAQANRILNEIEQEIADLESYIKVDENNGRIVESIKLLMTFFRLYQKLNSWIKMDYGPKNMLRVLDGDITKMMKRISIELLSVLKLPGLEIIAAKVRYWFTILLKLENAIDSAKLAIRIAFPQNFLKEWVYNINNWLLLKEKLSDININSFMAYKDERVWFGNNNYRLVIHENGGDLFNSVVLKNVISNFDKIFATMSNFKLSPTGQSQSAGLVLFSALFRQLNSELGDEIYDLIKTDKLKRERQIGQKILDLCLLLFDAKYDLLKSLFIEGISTLERIRTGKIGGKEGPSPSK